MLTDRYGLTLSTASPGARDAYVEGVDLILSGNAGPVAAFERALVVAPEFALAHVGKARALQLRGEMAAASQAIQQANAVARDLPAREASHLAYYNLVLAGQGAAAIAAAKAHLDIYPLDAMVLSPCTSVFGLIGFSGRRGREQEQVALLERHASHYGDDWWFNCQHAFALDEIGERDRARAKIERAMAAYPRNAHGAHIRAHVYYEDGEQRAALDYLRDWMRGYPKDAQLHCHLSWHLALCELEAGHDAAAWRIFAENVHPGATWGPPLNSLTDSIAFLWRFELAGGTRDPAAWRALHEFAHRMFPSAGIAFADVHVAIGDAVLGDQAGLEARLREMAALERQGKLPSGPVVPALARGFAAFVAGDWVGAIAAIEPVLAEHERIGGSRAQRDLVEFTLLKAYLNAGRFDDARHYLAGRREGATGVPVAGVPH
jgi:tetratricopeptide (TPR) repeat protein